MKQLTVNGVEIAYLDEGKGPAVIIGHCSSASHKEWLPLIETLKAGLARARPRLHRLWPIRTLAGRATLRHRRRCRCRCSRSPRRPKARSIWSGHSYGAALALEAARTLGSRVKSLTLVEPVSFHLLRQEGRPEWAEVETLGQAVLGAVAKGDDRAAAKAFMTYWLGRWRWWLSPERFKSAIAATIPKVALEFGIVTDAPTTLQDYAEVDGADAAHRRRQDRARRPAPWSIFWRRRCPMPRSRL